MSQGPKKSRTGRHKNMITITPEGIAASKAGSGRKVSAHLWFSLIVLLAFATLTASGQVLINPPTNSTLFSGPGPESLNTGPNGGLVIKGTAISVFTGQPVRHLWVANGGFSICRMDPELDAPGPWNINATTCTFKVNAGPVVPIPLGGQMVYDPARKFLYFVDNQATPQGVIRIGFNPAADGGHGMLDFNSAFTLGGGVTGKRAANFIGGTGCPLPGTPGQPTTLAMSPLGDLWVGFAASGEILRFNSPGTATATGFGSCSQFIEVVGAGPDNATISGLAWIGHDLWGADGTSLFVITNADSTCMIPPTPACTTANGLVVVAVITGPTTSLISDQFFPAINGNNLYFGIGSQLAWFGNVSGGPGGSTISVTYLNPSPAPVPVPAAVTTVVIDENDPANLAIYSAEDPGAAGVLGQARWWRTIQTPVPLAPPGIPLDVIAVAGNSQATVNWSPAQSVQPVTSYTVHTFFTSDASVVPDVIVNPAPGALFPPTSIAIPGLTNGVTYSFQVSATNGAGTSPLSVPGNFITLPGTAVPAAPTGATAVAGDTEAFVSWTISGNNGGSPITSYTVTVLIGGVATPITVTVPPPTGTTTGSVLIGGLINGTTYTFTVHATNVIGNSAESAQSNAVTPSAANLPTVTIAMAGPASVTATPAQLTYTITLRNTSNFPANVSVSDTLSTVPATISTVSRSATGVVTVTTSAPTSFAVNQIVTIAGVTDPSFNGTFTITNNPTSTTFTYTQAGPVAASASGTATLQPIANIQAVVPDQGACTAVGPGVTTFSCNVGSMAAGAVVRVNVIVQMQNQTIISSATVSGTDSAGTPIVSSSAGQTTAAPAPPPSGNGPSTDLQLTGKAAKGSVPVNTADSFTWVISNKGPVDAPNTVFSDVLPTSLQFSSATTTQGVCVGPPVGSLGGTVTCTTANLANAASFTVTVNVIVKVKASINNTGTVSFDGVDPKPSTNTFTVKIAGQ